MMQKCGRKAQEHGMEAQCLMKSKSPFSRVSLTQRRERCHHSCKNVELFLSEPERGKHEEEQSNEEKERTAGEGPFAWNPVASPSGLQPGPCEFGVSSRTDSPHESALLASR